MRCIEFLLVVGIMFPWSNSCASIKVTIFARPWRAARANVAIFVIYQRTEPTQIVSYLFCVRDPLTMDFRSSTTKAGGILGPDQLASACNTSQALAAEITTNRHQDSAEVHQALTKVPIRSRRDVRRNSG
jgi:hypothetical protein